MTAPNLSSAYPEETPSSRPLPGSATVTAGLASVTECLICGKPIRTMAFRFSGICSGNCQKTLADRNRRSVTGEETDETVVLP